MDAENDFKKLYQGEWKVDPWYEWTVEQLRFVEQSKFAPEADRKRARSVRRMKEKGEAS